MNILCKIFGHKLPLGYNYREGCAYLPVTLYGTDGLGRKHAFIRGYCRRCGNKFDVCMIHLPEG